MSAHQALRRALSYKKFRGSGPYRFLVPLTGYHLQQECARALRALGHSVLEVPLDPSSCSSSIRALLTQVVAFKPDALLVVNHLGFDDGHQLGQMLDACAVPVACWYCDSPFFVLKSSSLPAPQMTSLFVWEKTLLPTLGALGAQDVHHLPMGCDPELFAPANGAPAPPRYGLSFVGNSMRAACLQWQEALNADEHHLQGLWAAKLLPHSRQQLAGEVASMQRSRPQLAVWDTLGAATFEATRAYRIALLAKLPHQDLHIFGDPGWHGVLGQGAHLHPPVAYGPDLAEVYRTSAVNLNATSLQMPTAVNQRVFDGPAAGGFVLSDDQQDLHDLFDVGQEAVVYRSSGEFQELALHYQTRHDERLNIVRRAQKRIEACHTYKHRMQTMLSVLRARHG